MAKIRNPAPFSDFYGVPTETLFQLGILDPTLNVDTRLFIDPLLLTRSHHPEMSIGARRTYEQHFTKVIKFLQATTTINDVAWRTARRLLSFPEIKWTCLGYGALSVSGSGSGSGLTDQLFDTACEIVRLGVDDPDLFVAMALFEEGIGPARISDMTTNVIFPDLLHFNARMLRELNVPTNQQTLRLKNGTRYDVSLPNNPFIPEGGPVVLLPSDILRDFPVATDWSEVADAASKNEQLRNDVNYHISKLWEGKSREGKNQIKEWAMSSKEKFEQLLEIIRDTNADPYDTSGDPLGELSWRKIATTMANDEPLLIEQPETLDLIGVAHIVDNIIEQFRFLIEDRRFSEELYYGSKSRPEKAAQRLFFAVAYSYCKANDLDLTPEADTGNGPVDFKVSKGFSGRVLVEIKLSTNTKLVRGYTRQLEAYTTAEETERGYYLVIDVGKMGQKGENITCLSLKVIWQ